MTSAITINKCFNFAKQILKISHCKYCAINRFVYKNNVHSQNLSAPCLTGSLLQKRYAGHSKWANIKHKKMHKDNERAKTFGKFSLEIIQAVKENGPDPSQNSKLEAVISKAKAGSMPKDKIETSIRNAMRSSTEKLHELLIQARGPAKCGLMIDILTPNIVRSKNEIRGILKKNECTYTEDGSVAFMFLRKGVLSAVKDVNKVSPADEEEGEEIAIMIGAEDVVFDENDEEGTNLTQFICAPLEIINIQKELTSNYKDYRIISSENQYLANTLLSLNDEQMDEADRVIDIIMEHHDVINVYDNIRGYPSKTIKLSNDLTGS